MKILPDGWESNQNIGELTDVIRTKRSPRPKGDPRYFEWQIFLGL